MSEKRQKTGQEAELMAQEYLLRQGMEIIDRNVRFKVGEIDLVARDGDTIVFVEVRSRTCSDIHPAATVTRAKQKHIVRAAEAYLQRHRLGEVMARFDVIAVFLEKGEIEHFPNAFDAGR